MNYRKSIAPIVLVLAVIAPHADAAGFLQGFRFEAGGVYASIDPGHFSEGMKRLGSDKWISSIDGVSGIEAGIGYQVSSHLGVCVRSGYAFGSNRVPIKLGISLDPFEFIDSELEIRIADVPLVLALDYRATRDRWTAAIELAGEAHFVEVSDRTPEVESYGIEAHKNIWGEETTLGAHAALAVEWSPWSKLSLGARAGHRVIGTTQFESFSVEFGGWFFGFFIGLKPWA